MKSTSTVSYLDNIRSLLQTGTMRQLFFMLGLAVSVALGIVLYMTIQEPIYRPLDYQVTQQNMSAIIDTLDKAGVQYKVNDRDGVIYVAAKDLQLAKLKLSASGIPKDDNFNYSFLNEQNSFGNSQFLENARYLRALEGDLSKTINAIEGVAAARVHIAVPQNTIFADESTKTTASVVISAAPGVAADKEKIRAIIQIVAGSVPGLDPKDVAITDQYGHFLSSELDPNSIFNTEQLNYQNNIQDFYEKRIESMIMPMLGENKVTVRVYADIDFTQQEEAKEQYDPDKKVLRSEQSMSESSDAGGASGAPGSLANTPPPDSDKSGDSAPAAKSGSSQGRSQSTKNYEITKSVNYKKTNAATIRSLSVAVIVDNEMVMDPKTKQYVAKPVDQDKINKITSLVQTTIGYNQARGDKVTVVNSGFNLTKHDIPPIITHLWEQPWFWDMGKKLIGILFGFIFMVILYRRLSRGSYGSQMQRKVSARLESDNFEVEQQAQEKALHGAKQEKINQVKQLAATEPTKVASVIKNWVGK
jgi:flagellar M-ring protein FliF